MHKGIYGIVCAGLSAYTLVTVVNVASTNSYASRVFAETDALLASIEAQNNEREARISAEIEELYKKQDTVVVILEEPEPIQIETQESASEEDVPPALAVSDGFECTSLADMYEVQINKSYSIPKEFYYDILPETMYPIVDSVCYLEETQDISSMFLLAVAAVETGWGKTFYIPGNNNWFNWTADTIDYQSFDSADECVLYTGEKFQERFFNPEFYAIYGQLVDDCFTVSEVNTRYALNPDLSVNWAWSDVVCEIMCSFNNKYQLWKEEIYDL